MTRPANASAGLLGAVALLAAGCGSDRLRPVAEPPAPAQAQQSADSCSTDPSGVLGVCDGVGACGLGQDTICSDARWYCIDRGVPAPETCNGLDDDCDGQTDESLFADCYSGPRNTLGVGLCAAGISRCGDATCYFEVVPQVEVCNGVDDDCNGLVDDGVAGIPGCCSPPDPEVCDGLDNDCNGAIDEDLLDACGHCDGDEPDEIPCNHIDDDCDGFTDEDDPPAFEVAIAIDTSGSNADAVAHQKAEMQAAVGDISALILCATWDVVAFPTNPSGVGGTTIYAETATGAEAVAALSVMAPGPGYIEPSYDVLEMLAVPHVPRATRSVVLFEDEEGQSLLGQDQVAAAIALAVYGVRALTFTARPDTFWMCGPTQPLDADIRGETVAFLRARVGP